MRGEDSIWNIHTGTSPHAWGRQGCTSLTKAPAGTSPRAWGRLFELRFGHRNIPTSVGKTPAFTSACTGTSPHAWGRRYDLLGYRSGTYPHAWGRHDHGSLHITRGTSPHAWGRLFERIRRRARGNIPTYVGKTSGLWNFKPPP